MAYSKRETYHWMQRRCALDARRYYDKSSPQHLHQLLRLRQELLMNLDLEKKHNEPLTRVHDQKASRIQQIANPLN